MLLRKMDEGVESDGRFEWMVVPTCDEVGARVHGSSVQQ